MDFSNLISSLSPINIFNESPAIAIGLSALAAGSYVVPKIRPTSSVKRISNIIATIVVIVIICMMWFYRHPQETLRKDLVAGEVLSPAYGTVYEILPVTKDIQNDSSFNETHANATPIQYTHISIFLSPADVHVQYVPTQSRFVKTTYDATGKFELAYEMNKSNENEKAITELLPVPVTTPDGTITIPPVFVTQIAGFLVRRINTKKFIPSDLLIPGQELGMIKFGSRVDIELPTDFYDIDVKEGQYLYGPDTKLAVLKPGLADKAIK